MKAPSNDLEGVEFFEAIAEEYHSRDEKLNAHIGKNLAEQTQVIAEGQFEEAVAFKAEFMPAIQKVSS